MTLLNKKKLKEVLGDLPLTAEVYWRLRQQSKPLSESFSLQRTEEWLPIWRAQAEAAAARSHVGKRILLFATLRYWIENATLLGMAIAGMGNEVTLAYLPYANWSKPLNHFDLRRQNAYSQKVFAQAAPLLKAVSWLDYKAPSNQLPEEIKAAIAEVSLRDVQYTLQIEDVDLSSELYLLRLERNTQAAQAALSWIQEHNPDAIITPNGSILEMGIVYQVARYLGVPVVTYEFGEQRDRIWLAQNAEVMRQETDALWETRKGLTLNDEQWDRVRELFSSRQRADLWGNFSRRWQGIPGQGGEQARLDLGLDGASADARPVFLLAANVIGDSLTLGRQVFTDNMTQWLQETVVYFTEHPNTQLVVRIHPGERYTKGPSVAEVVKSALPDLPDHIHLVGADDPVNTYDLVEIADVGLVYTTTVGMEMAMSGVPVIVAGHTHYREKGFTIDPDSWDAYYQVLAQTLADPQAYRLSRHQVDLAWNYAYRFFFEYPFPFPWHLLHFWNELENWSVEKVLSKGGQAIFGDSFRYLMGEPVNWNRSPEALSQDILTEK